MLLAYTNLHKNEYTSNHLIYPFLSDPLYSHQIKTTETLTARPQHISVTTLVTAPLSLPPHPTTHSHNPTLLTRVLLKLYNPLFPSLVNPHHGLKHIPRYTHASARLYRPVPVHTLHCLPAKPLDHVSQHKATFSPRQISLLSSSVLEGRDAADPLSFAAASEWEGKECGLALCRAARGHCPSLHCPLKATRREEPPGTAPVCPDGRPSSSPGNPSESGTLRH